MRSSGSVTVTVSSGQASVCTFFNRFIPAGSISISKISQGATGTFAFLVGLRDNDTGMQYHQRATTTAQGQAANAEPVRTRRDRSSEARPIPHRRAVPLSDPTNAWAVSSVYCNGVAQPFTSGVVEVRLTRHEPDVHCTYTDTFTPKPPPIPPPPEPTPPPPPPNPPLPPMPPAPPPEPDVNPIYANADLSVNKARKHRLGDRRPRGHLPGDRPQPRPRGRTAGVRRGPVAPRGQGRVDPHIEGQLRLRPTVEVFSREPEEGRAGRDHRARGPAAG